MRTSERSGRAVIAPDMAPHELREGCYLVSTDPSLLDVPRVHAWLTKSYWAEGITLDAVTRSIERSIPFGAYHQGVQVGVARVISDTSTLAYVADVFVDEAHRGRGLGKLLMRAVMSHPDLQEVRRWLLGTRDAHGLYVQFGFGPLERPERWMEAAAPDVYKHEGG